MLLAIYVGTQYYVLHVDKQIGQVDVHVHVHVYVLV